VAANPTRRQQQAAETREEIVGRARELFATKGYRATTIRDVAAAAGVSVQTVYDSVGSKRALVLALNDRMAVEAGIPQLSRQAGEEEDPAAVLAIPGRVARALLEHCGDIIRASISAAGEEPDVAEVVAEGHRRHRAGVARVFARLAALDALPDDADVRALQDTVAVLCDVSTGTLLIDRYGWSAERVERWMVQTTAALVPLR
jgi:AcrR family transcriptional regulator